MTHQQVQQWLDEKAAKNDVMAQAYLSLLKDATPEMKAYWYDQLGTMLKAAEVIVAQLKAENAGDA